MVGTSAAAEVILPLIVLRRLGWLVARSKRRVGAVQARFKRKLDSRHDQLRRYIGDSAGTCARGSGSSTSTTPSRSSGSTRRAATPRTARSGSSATRSTSTGTSTSTARPAPSSPPTRGRTSAAGARAGTCIDPKTQIVEGKTVCLVSCRRSPEPVYLRWRGEEKAAEGDLYVRSGPGTIRLDAADTAEYVATRFGAQ